MARQRGNSWQADVLGLDGKRIRKSFDTQAAAEEFEASFNKVASTVGTVFPQQAKVIWHGLKDEPECIRMTNMVVAFWGPNLPVKDIDEFRIEEYRDHCRELGNSPSTINNKLTRLSVLLKKLKKLKLIAAVPEIEKEKNYSKRIRYFTPEEEANIRKHLPQEKYQLLWDFLNDTGVRVSEALEMEWRDVVNGYATFWLTKGDRARTIPLTKKALASIRFDQKDDLARPFGDVTYTGMYQEFKKTKKRAGLGDDQQVVLHTARHTCASRLVQKGVDIRRVKEWLGHADIATTMRYAHLAPKDLDTGRDALETQAA